VKISDLAKSYVRTIVPLAVGLIITLGIRAGVDLHGYSSLIDSAVTAVYYIGVRALEHYVDGRFGWLLGVAAAPKYKAATTHSEKTAGTITLQELAVLAVIALVVVVILVLLHAI